MMERADPLFLLMGLPTIPVVLVLGKMIRWEDYIVRLWQRYAYKGNLLPGINTHTHTSVPCSSDVFELIQAKIICVFPPGNSRYLPRVPVDGPGAGDHLSVSRTLCGALIFPSIASLVGRLLFRRMPSNLQRTILVKFYCIFATRIFKFAQSLCLAAVTETSVKILLDAFFWRFSEPVQLVGDPGVDPEQRLYISCGLEYLVKSASTATQRPIRSRRWMDGWMDGVFFYLD